MRYQPTILNISAGVFLIGVAAYTFLNYRQLSAGEGWGVVAMVGLLGVGIALIVIDLVIQLIFRSEKSKNIVGACVVLVTAIWLLLFNQ